MMVIKRRPPNGCRRRSGCRFRGVGVGAPSDNVSVRRNRGAAISGHERERKCMVDRWMMGGGEERGVGLEVVFIIGALSQLGGDKARG